MTLAVAAAVPIPLLNDPWTILACLFIVLLFGGALMPVMIGLMNASVPSDLRTFGNSIGQFFFNCLGYMPAPFLYGVIET
jgi:MFS family permease